MAQTLAQAKNASDENADLDAVHNNAGTEAAARDEVVIADLDLSMVADVRKRIPLRTSARNASLVYDVR
jgi:predicted amidohydrolase